MQEEKPPKRLVQSWIGIVIRAVRFCWSPKVLATIRNGEARARRSQGRC